MSHFNRVNNIRLIRVANIIFFHPKRPYKYYICIKTSLGLIGFNVVRVEKTDLGENLLQRFRGDINRLSLRLILKTRDGCCGRRTSFWAYPSAKLNRRPKRQRNIHKEFIPRSSWSSWSCVLLYKIVSIIKTNSVFAKFFYSFREIRLFRLNRSKYNLFEPIAIVCWSSQRIQDLRSQHRLLHKT